MADVGCRNTVFEGRPQVAAAHLPAWLAAGLRDFRLEFVHESPQEVSAVIQAHRAFLGGEIGAPELERRLAAVSGQGVTEGSFFVPEGFDRLPALPVV